MGAPMGQGRRLGAALAVVACLLAAAVPGLGEAAAPAAGPAFEGLPREVQHEVERGQDLHLIAGYYYGNARQWEMIWQANRDVIKNPNRLTPGTTLRIPVDRTWKQDLSYADWLKIGGEARARARAGAAPRAEPPASPLPPAAPPPPPTKGTAAPPTTKTKKSVGAAPAGQPGPPPPGPPTPAPAAPPGPPLMKKPGAPAPPGPIPVTPPVSAPPGR